MVKMSKILTSGNKFELVFISYQPVGFHVDIEIYKDKLGQSGDRIIEVI